MLSNPSEIYIMSIPSGSSLIPVIGAQIFDLAFFLEATRQKNLYDEIERKKLEAIVKENTAENDYNHLQHYAINQAEKDFNLANSLYKEKTIVWHWHPFFDIIPHFTREFKWAKDCNCYMFRDFLISCDAEYWQHQDVSHDVNKEFRSLNEIRRWYLESHAEFRTVENDIRTLEREAEKRPYEKFMHMKGLGDVYLTLEEYNDLMSDVKELL